MSEKVNMRMKMIHAKMAAYRRRKEKRRLAETCALSFALVCGIGGVLKDVEAGSFISAEADNGVAGYGAVLLHDAANVYIIVGIAAFVAGAALTAVCVKHKEKARRKNSHGKEENL